MDESVLQRLEREIAARKGSDPAASYVASLFARGQDAILKKVGEEATEAVIASKSGLASAVVHETADLWFHCLVMLSWHGLSASDVFRELERREGISGHSEKAGRGSPKTEGGK